MFLLFFILMVVTQHAFGVEVIEGAESVVLPCEAPPGAASSVVWSRYDLNPPNVHLRTKIGQQPEKDDLTNQNPQFTNRTEVQPDALTTGHVSLTLKHIQLADGGIYTCLARGGGEKLTETQVELQVTRKKDEQARRRLIILITVGTIILCIVAAVLGWLYHLGYIWQKDKQEVVVDSGVTSVLLRRRTIRLLPKDVRVQWTTGDRMVHESLKGSDQPGEQDEDYKGRTEMRRNLRILVDLSLTLKHPTDRDSNTYTCTVYSRERKVLMRREVWLDVKVPEVEVDSGVKSVLLPCETIVQLPEDVRVEWTDGDMKKLHVSLNGSDQPGEQEKLYRGRTEMKRERPGDLSLTLKHPTVRDRDIYTCTVYSREGDVLMVRQVKLEVKVHQVEVDSGVESVLLPCEGRVQLSEDIRVKWTDGDYLMVHVSLKGSDQPGEQDDLYRGRTEMKRDLQRPGDLSLTLKHPTDRDSKTYTCTVYSREGDFLMEKHVELKVKDCWVEVEEGEESVLLPFKTTDLPEDVRVTWRRLDTIETVHVFQDGSDQQDQQDLSYRGRTEMKGDLNQGDVSLILKHPTERDGGRYICSVYSKKGDIRRETIVDLYIIEQQVEVEEGAECVLLPFKTTELSEDARVTWRRLDSMETIHVFENGSDQQDQQDPSYRGRTEMKGDLRQGDVSLILKHPTGRDRGRYICSVYSREEDIRRETTVRLYIIDCKVEVEEGEESVLLPFKITDLPEDVRVTWRRHDTMETIHVFQDGSEQQDQQDLFYRGRTEMKRDLRQGDVSLILKHPTGRDEGRYICSVYSKEGDIRRETTVELWVTECWVVVEEGEESVLLPFKTTELPEDVRVTWRRHKPMETVHVFQNGSEQQDQQDLFYRGRTEMKGDLKQGDVSLILKHPTERDEGRYICSVYSKKGDIRRETIVELRVTVRQVKKEEESVLQPEVPELKSTHEGYQLVNMDPAESC